jgi:hypothetical protein
MKNSCEVVFFCRIAENTQIFTMNPEGLARKILVKKSIKSLPLSFSSVTVESENIFGEKGKGTAGRVGEGLEGLLEDLSARKNSGGYCSDLEG